LIKENYKINNIPLITCYNKKEEAISKGTIIFFHGLFGSKESNVSELETLANEGYFAIGIDNLNHGERKEESLDKINELSKMDGELYFLEMVINTAKEIPKLIDELINRGLIKDEKVSLAGVSMGGYITYSVISIDSRIKTAVTIVGSPQYNVDLESSPHNFISKFDTIKILSINASLDDIVPTEYMRAFHEKLKKTYPDYEDRFKYIEFENSGHMMEEEDWDQSIKLMVEWFSKFF